MRKLLAIFAFVLCCGILPQSEPARACTAPCAKSQITTDINTNWPDNTTQQITPALLRSTVLELVNSYLDANGSSSFTCSTHQFLTAIATLSSYTCAQPAFADISGTASNGQLANSSITLGGVAVSLGGTYSPVRASTASGSPGAGTTNTSPFVMAGLGRTFTPATTGNVEFVLSINASNNTTNDGCAVQMAWGTGASPTHNSALTGTTVGSQSSFSGVGGGGQSLTLPANGYVTGLTVSTTYWIDVQYAAVTGGTCTLGGYSIQALEQ
jgi:hypothetical protein